MEELRKTDESKADTGDGQDPDQPVVGSVMHRGVSRREFLKIAGIAGAAVGLGGGLAGLVGACGEAATTTTTPTTSSSATSSTETTSSASSTTVSTGVTAGRPVKVGFVMPLTGSLASFSIPLDFIVPIWKKAVEGGVVLGDGQKHDIEIVQVDTQSDSSRSAGVTADLIINEKVDIVMSSGTPEVVEPSADQCEANGVPFLSAFDPWESFVFARGGTFEKPFKWTFVSGPGIHDFMVTDLDMVGQVSTNKVVGLLFPNTADGQAFADETSGYPALLQEAGYSYEMPSLYVPGSDDYTMQISQFKSKGCEILMTCAQPPEFSNFWMQSLRMGWRPKVVDTELALMFPEALSAIGPTVAGVVTPVSWHPAWPYKSSFDGMNCQDFANAYETSTGRQWTGAIAVFNLFEWAVDILKRTANVDDKESILKSLLETKMTTLVGDIDFTVPVGQPTRPVFNCATCSMGGGQWIKGTGKWMFDLVEVSNVKGPDLPVSGKVTPMSYS